MREDNHVLGYACPHPAIRGIIALRLLDLDQATGADFAGEIGRRAGTDVSACYACGKCSAGCPLASEMDLQPHQVVHLINLGRKDDVLTSRTIWLCASCVTCTVRCPHDVDLARVMDVLREMCLTGRIKPAEPAIRAFNRSFLGVLRWGGRLHEFSMTAAYKLLSRDIFGDLKLGAALLRRGKLKLVPSRARAHREVAAIIDRVRQLEAADPGDEVARR